MVLIRAGLVCVVAALGEHSRTVADFVTQSLLGSMQELWVRDDLIVIDEYNTLVSQNSGGDEPDIADRTIAREPDTRDHVRELELLQPAMQRTEFRGPEDESIETGEIRKNPANTLFGLMLDGRVGRSDHDDDLLETLNLLKRS